MITPLWSADKQESASFDYSHTVFGIGISVSDLPVHLGNIFPLLPSGFVGVVITY